MCEEGMWLHTVPEAAFNAKTPILSSSSMLTYGSHKSRYISGEAKQHPTNYSVQIIYSSYLCRYIANVLDDQREDLSLVY